MQLRNFFNSALHQPPQAVPGASIINRLRAAVGHRRAPTLAALLILVLVPIAYSAPLLTSGLDDLRMARHFDQGESEVALGWIESYTRSPLYAGYENHWLAYPKLFYNTAGIFLYPYSNIQGEDYRAVITVWRGSNMVIGAAALVVLFFLGRRVFHSNRVAFLASLLFAITPQFLIWTANIRPNPMEQLLIFTSLLFLMRLCERFTFTTFLLATTAGALAFATKFGSIPLIILIPIFSVYLVRRQGRDPEEFNRIIREAAKVLKFVLPAVGSLLGLGAVALLLGLASNGWDSASLLYNLAQAGVHPDKLPRLQEDLDRFGWLVNIVAWGGLIGLGLGTGLTMGIYLRLRTWAAATVARPTLELYGSLLVSFGILIAVIYPAVFFITGPAYGANPEHFFSQVGYEFRNIMLATSYGDAEPPTLLENAFQKIGLFHPGWLAFLALLGFAAYLNIRWGSDSLIERDQRIALWSFVGLSLALFLITRSAQMRHILPMVGVLYIFVAEAVARGAMRFGAGRARAAATTSLAALVIIGAGFSLWETSQDWRKFMDKPNDIGIQVGKTLTASYPEDARILTNNWIFYVPPQFKNVKSTRLSDDPWARESVARKQEAMTELILEYDPNVVVVANSEIHTTRIDLAAMLATEPALKERGYREVKRFYAGRPRDEYYEVIIFERSSSGYSSIPSD